MNGNHLIRSGGASGAPVVSDPGSEDPFEVTFRPAKPVLDAVIEMREPLRWLDQRRRSRRPLFEPDRAGELIDLIPSGGRIAKSGALFLEAVEISAPEGWLHIAIGIMLQSQPDLTAIDGDAYRCAVTDGAFQDPEIWEYYGPGFSPAVIVRAIRQVRREYDELPSPGRFLNICVKQRAWFKARNADLSILLNLRWQAEDALEESGQPLPLTHDPDDEMHIPF